MKTAFIAFLLSCAATAIAQIPAEKPVIENYIYNTAPRFGANNFRTGDFTYEPTYQNIKPPLEDLKIAKENNSVASKQGAKLSYSSGTSITIPPNAFVDENGNPIEGNVSVSFREYKNPLDFLLGGIPMSYDSSANKNMFLSAGMFELTASVNGKQVFLKKGSMIDVQMTSMDAQPDYNLYAFNDATGNWEMKTDKSNVAVKNNSNYFYSPAISKYMNALTYGVSQGYDSTSFAQRFASMDYYYTRRSNVKEMAQNRWWWGGKYYRALIKISGTHKIKNGDITFRIARTIGTTRELAPYQYVDWKLESTMDYQQFKQLTGFKNYFFDVQIEQDGDAYIIKLKGINGFKEIKAVPVKMNSDYEFSEMPVKEKNRMYKRYSKILKCNEKFFNKQLAKGNLDDNYIKLTPEERPAYAWNFAKPFMTSEENKMTMMQWQNYVDEKQEAQGQATASATIAGQNITRSFSIDGMGIWNCDQIKRLQNPVQVAASYTNEYGKKINAVATFIIDKKLNGILQYYNPDQIAFSKTAETILVAIEGNGAIAIATPEYFKGKKFYDNKPYTFPLKELSAGTESVRELKKLMGL